MVQKLMKIHKVESEQDYENSEETEKITPEEHERRMKALRDAGLIK